jgi:hypothetical protein
VTHRCTVTGPGKEIDRFIEKVIAKNDEGEKYFDFNALIPRPESLNITSTSYDTEFFALGIESTEGGMMGAIRQMMGKERETPLEYDWVKKAGIKTREELLAWLEANKPDSLKNACKAAENLEQYGHTDWYGWNTCNWGTKWNSYGFSEAERVNGTYEFSFETAWSPPVPIFEKLAEEFPELTFEFLYFDEGWNFAGTATLENGACVDDSKEATAELYEQVYGCPPPDYDDEEE